MNGKGISRSILHQTKRFKENLLGKGVLALLDFLTEVRKAQNPVQTSQRQVSDKTNLNIQDTNSKGLTCKAIVDAHLKAGEKLGGSRKSEDSSSSEVRLGASNSRSTVVASPEEVRLTHQLRKRNLRTERCSENSWHIQSEPYVDTSDERRNAEEIEENTLSQKEAEYNHQRTARRSSNDRVTSPMKINNNPKEIKVFRWFSRRNEDGDLETASGNRQVVPHTVSLDLHPRETSASRFGVSGVFNFSSSFLPTTTLPTMIPSPLAMNHREVSTLFFNDCEPLSMKQSPLVKYSVPHYR